MTPPEDLREALEDALADNPDDLASHMAYADHLVEEGDPRGEFIQVQLALEDQSRSVEERKRLQQREQALLKAHEREWLGELAPILLGTSEQLRELFRAEVESRYQNRINSDFGADLTFRHGWARGWLDSFECNLLSVEMARKLGHKSIALLLRRLVVRGDEAGAFYRYQPGRDIPAEHGRFRPCEVLARYPVVRNLRFFQYGNEVDPEEDTYYAGTHFDRLAPLVGAMSQLEELRIFGHIYPSEEGERDLSQLFSLVTLANLRILWHYHGHNYPLHKLAENSALGRMTHLLCFPHSYARELTFLESPPHGIDEGPPVINRDNVRPLLFSPYLRSLTHLQLRMCDGGDDTIRDVIKSGILKRLKMLDLRHGRVTDEGAQLLADCPEARHLDSLDLIGNRLTVTGIEALQSAGIRVRTDRQQHAPYDEEDYLYYGDSE
jgi:uncharacterized protein (TIGR02996 family)